MAGLGNSRRMVQLEFEVRSKLRSAYYDLSALPVSDFRANLVEYNVLLT